MVYTFLTGRIGNNLFQIATAAALARRNNTDFTACITKCWCQEPDNCYLDEYLEQFKTNLLRNINLISELPGDAMVFDQVIRVEQIPYFNNICLHGLWQSENYFKDQRDHILKIFSVDEITDTFIKKKYGNIFDKEVISVVIRRGDYCRQPEYHPTCSMTYYRNAIRYLGKEKRYLFISDDIVWCREKFSGENYFFADHDSPVVDLYLPTYCTHNIISNSSFAWWGAWLNPNPDKIVIAPGNNWCGYYYKSFCRPEMLPEEWVRMYNPLSLGNKIKVLKAVIINKLLPVKHTFEKLTGKKLKFLKSFSTN